MKYGNYIKGDGCIFENIISPNTLLLNGTHLNTICMHDYIIEFGQYFAVGDATYGTNQYGFQRIIICMGIKRHFYVKPHNYVIKCYYTIKEPRNMIQTQKNRIKYKDCTE